MALQTEVWSADIAANLFPNNSFLARTMSDDMYVENKTVHKPQSGTFPTIVRNRTSYPATITTRVDTEITYNLVEFTSNPTLITDIDAIEVSYQKRTNILRDHVEQIRRKAADYLLYSWCPDSTNASTQIIPTSGSVRATNAPGGTSTRKALTRADIVKLKANFDSQEIPQEGRYLLLDSAMYADLLADTTITSRDWTQSNSLETGAIGMLLGFSIFMRAFVGRMATANTSAKDPDAANATSDNAFSLAWQESYLCRALGEVKVYADEDKPEYFGSIFSSMVRVGGSRQYTNFRGVAALVEN